MKYSVDYLPEKKIINIKMSGRINYQTAEKYSKEAVKLSKEHKCSKFLIDHKETVMNFQVTNLYTTGAELQQFGFKCSDKIAIIIQDLNSYKNSIASPDRNTNWSTAKFFCSKDTSEALNWLLN